MKRITNQHGDVLLEKIETIPTDAKKLKVINGFIIETGEGRHTHILKKVCPCSRESESPLALKDISSDVEVWSLNDSMFIKVKKGETVVIDHEEHGKQILKEGIYKKIIEREYSYEDNEERRVLD
ncbi:MAG: hypothetical protein WC390_09140 [Sulfurimonas sp.]|jgi:hypothetical protein